MCVCSVLAKYWYVSSERERIVSLDSEEEVMMVMVVVRMVRVMMVMWKKTIKK